MDTFLITAFEPKFMSGIDEYIIAGNLLLMYFREKGIRYYRRPEDGGSFQLYYRLKNTGLSVQHCISVKGLRYMCQTRAAEIHPRTRDAYFRLQALTETMNSRIESGRFAVDDGPGQLRFCDGFRIAPEMETANAEMLYDQFDRLIYRPQYLMDVEFADELTEFRKKSMGEAAAGSGKRE